MCKDPLMSGSLDVAQEMHGSLLASDSFHLAIAIGLDYPTGQSHHFSDRSPKRDR